MPSSKTIVITGASSGIGQALAEAYAAPGVFLALTGRDETRLAAVAETCRAKGAEVAPKVIDVADRDAMAAWLTEMDDNRSVDLIIANAGVGEAGAKLEDLAEATAKTFDVNVHGVFNTILPLLTRMRDRGHGQIAINASLAAYRGLPMGVPYGASKAAVKAYGEGLRAAVARYGIAVSVICPGFVESRMTAKNRFKMPFLMTAEKAAGIIRRGLRRNRTVIAFPLPTFLVVRTLSIVPAGMAHWLTRRR